MREALNHAFNLCLFPQDSKAHMFNVAWIVVLFVFTDRIRKLAIDINLMYQRINLDGLSK
jgi:hypothetical protein